MELNYSSPRIVGTYNQVIITEKIDANSIKDEEAKEHLYNIGRLILKYRSYKERKTTKSDYIV